MKVNYTYWGGVVGPRMLNLKRCLNCRCQFNGNTGKSATRGIIIYHVVSAAIAILILVGLRFLR